MSLTLDGSNRVVATEFIKLEITGTSNLATENYVNTAVANGGVGGGTGTTDLTNYYNKTETDAFLNNKYNKTETDTLLNDKLNINNPQDMAGTLRLGYVLGTSKIVLNAVSSDKDFYVNGDAQVGGNHLVASLDSSGYIKGSNIQSNTFNALNLNDILFQSNNDTYLQYDVSATKLVASKLIQCGGNLTTQEIDTIAPLDLIIKRGGVDYITLADGVIQFSQPTNLAITPDLSNCVKLTGEASQTIAGDVVVGGALNANTLNSNGNSDIVLQRNGVEYMKLEWTLQAVELTKGAKSNTYDSIGNADVNFRRNAIDFFCLRNNTLDLNTGISLSSDVASINEISSKTATNLVIQRAGVNCITLTDGQIQFNQPTNLATGGDTSNCVKYTGETLQTIEGDVVIGGGTQFSTYDLTVNGISYFNAAIEFPLGGAINLGTGKGYLRSINLGSGNTGYDYCIFGGGGLHRFYVGGSPFPQYLRFQLSSTQAYFNVDVVCHTELQTDVINKKNAADVDLVFKIGDVEYMKFEGTLQAVELTKGAKSNTYDSIGNADVSFRRNTVDFMYLRNGNVEVNTGVSLVAESGKFDVIDSATPSNVVFKRGGVNFFTLDGTKNIIDVSTGRALSSQYIYGDFFIHRNSGADMVFQGSNTTDDGSVEFLRYRKADEDVNFSKDIYVNQDKKAYFHKETGKNSYIFNENTAGVNHFKFINEDPNGDIRFYANNSMKLFVTPSKVSVPAPYTLEGDLVDTSDFTKKYDIKSIEHNFTDIVKQIEPKTFKMEDEKEIGITKNHLGFIADEIVEAIPPEWENIVRVDDEGIKKLSYIKLSGILWGCVREQQTKIEHLEASVYELQEAMKDASAETGRSPLNAFQAETSRGSRDLMKSKPKVKAKAKSKDN